MSWVACAPSNIALIKYMGKLDEKQNIPLNASLSFTSHNFISKAELEVADDTAGDCWRSFDDGSVFAGTNLSEAEQSKYLRHLGFIKSRLRFSGNFILKSGNNFPKGAGIASSASSFAALTKAAVQAICELKGEAELSVEQMAALSRVGSGSSCRSFFSPWALWNKEEVKSLSFGEFDHLFHQIIIVSDKAKEVSSSQAHRLVKTSLLHKDRADRVEIRLKQLIKALESGDWRAVFKICWAEFADMHALFATCDEPFSYISSDSVKVLSAIRSFWSTYGDGPVATMDAGANVHLLWRQDQSEQQRQFYNLPELADFKLINDGNYRSKR
ncbi:MAG: hypothetical protein LBL30_03425 [Holosporales bacterium]|jgi:diphosphomevalonate decarboxylase|nr:hypothetical protein [Holosporales bacterium]